MGKRIVICFFLMSVVALLVVGGVYVHQSGLLRKYPDAEYLSDDEAAYRPVYRGLSKDEQAVYEALLRGMTAQKKTIELPKEINGDDYSRLYCIIEKQEGTLFYADSTYFTAERVRDAQVQYREDKDAVSAKIDEFKEAEEKAVKSCKASDDFETALNIHDYIIKKCRYIIGDDKLYSSTAYGCLVEGEANCEGYAKAFDLIAHDCGLESLLVTGVTDKGENHAWNQVKIDGEWYELDVTWDDTDDNEKIRKMYFLCPDKEFGKTHIADNAYFKPFECNATESNFYVRSGLYVEDLNDAEQVIVEKLESGAEEIEMKFASEEAYDEFKDEFIDGQRIFELMMIHLDGGKNVPQISLSEYPRELCAVITIH